MRAGGWSCVTLALAVLVAPVQAQQIGAADAVAVTMASAAETQAAEQRVADQTIRTLRRNVNRLSADVEAGHAPITQLTSAREALVAQLAARDADYARFVASFREQVETIAETEEGRALLAQRQPGHLAGLPATAAPARCLGLGAPPAQGRNAPRRVGGYGDHEA